MKQQKNHVKMTYDIVFKKFFTDKPEMLKLILKHFLEIDSIKEITITNPEIPELEETGLERKKKEKQVFKVHPNKNLMKQQVHSSGLTKNLGKSHQEKTLIEDEIIKPKDKEELIFLDSSLPAESREGKRVFLDLRVKLSTGEDINVEMQSYYGEKFLSRILYYWSKLHSQSLKAGESYNKVTPSYSLIFTEKPFLDKKVRDFMSSFSIKRDKEPYILFNKDLRIVIVELSKLNKSRSDLLDFKELWCYFIKESGNLTREDCEYLSRYKELEEAMKHFYKLSEEEKIKQAALDKYLTELTHELDRQGIEEKLEKGMKEGIQKGMKEGVVKGIEQGREQGRKEGKADLILKMLEKGCSIFELSKMTDLSESEILKLKNGSK